jgi:hypothetical protein
MDGCERRAAGFIPAVYPGRDPLVNVIFGPSSYHVFPPTGDTAAPCANLKRRFTLTLMWPQLESL